MTDLNDQWFARAKDVIPGGVNSPVRAYGSVGGTPRFVQSASGPRITDAAGREYVDLVASWGPALLGHAHPEVVGAVQSAASRGCRSVRRRGPRWSSPTSSRSACRSAT